MRALAAAITLAGCARLSPVLPPTCGAVKIAPALLATAGHCPTYGAEAYRDERADLQLVTRERAGAVASLQILPIEAGSRATLRGREFVVTDTLIESDGRFFLRAWPELHPGDSGFGLWQKGRLLGVAIGNDGSRAVFVHAGELSRALRRAKEKP